MMFYTGQSSSFSGAQGSDPLSGFVISFASTGISHGLEGSGAAALTSGVGGAAFNAGMGAAGSLIGYLANQAQQQKKEGIDWDKVVRQADDFLMVAMQVDGPLVFGDAVGVIGIGGARMGRAIFGGSKVANGGASLGAGRAVVKRWLQNAGNLERNQLIRDIESAGFKKVFDGKGMMHFERGGMKIRLDPPQPGTPFNHMHLNY